MNEQDRHFWESMVAHWDELIRIAEAHGLEDFVKAYQEERAKAEKKLREGENPATAPFFFCGRRRHACLLSFAGSSHGDKSLHAHGARCCYSLPFSGSSIWKELVRSPIMASLANASSESRSQPPGRERLRESSGSDQSPTSSPAT